MKSVLPLPDPHALAAADTNPVPSTWRHLVEPVPVEEITKEVVVALPVTFTLPLNVDVEFVPLTVRKPCKVLVPVVDP